MVLTADDDKSVGSSTSARSKSSKTSSSSSIPRCFCSWKNCRSWQKAFRDNDSKIWNGVVGINWDICSDRLKKRWDKFLKVEDEQRIQRKYTVARHHFPEQMMLKMLVGPDDWDWNTVWSKKEAEHYYGFLPVSAITGKDNMYFKLPLVPKDIVKEMVRKVRKNTLEAPATILEEPANYNSTSARRRGSLSPQGRERPKIGRRSSRSLSPDKDLLAQSMPPLGRDFSGGDDRPSSSTLWDPFARPPGSSMAPPSRGGVDNDPPLMGLQQRSRALDPSMVRYDDSERSTRESRGGGRRSRGQDEDDPVVPFKPKSFVRNAEDSFASPISRPAPVRRGETGGLPARSLDEHLNQPRPLSPIGGGRTSRHGEEIDSGSVQSRRSERSPRGRGGRGGPRVIGKKASRNLSTGLTEMTSRKVRDDLEKQQKIQQIVEEEHLEQSRKLMNLEEEKKDGVGMEMMQISVQEYQALLRERDDLHATSQKQSITISELNNKVAQLKSDVLDYIEKAEDKNDELGELEDKLHRVSGAGLDIGALTLADLEGKDPLTTIELLKIENERLNTKAAYLAQRSKTHERTIAELEEKLREVCDGAIDREQELQELLVADPWDQIVGGLLQGWGFQKQKEENEFINVELAKRARQ